MENDEFRLITLNIGRELYGIDIFSIDCIIKPVKITPVPLVDDCFLGVINMRGTVLPVISMRKKLGFEECEHTEEERILILRTDNKELIGLEVDKVNDVISVKDNYTEEITENIRNRVLISGVVKDESGLVSVLNINAFLGTITNEER